MTDNKNKDKLPEPVISIEASDRAGTSIDIPIKAKKLKKQQRKKALNFISLANVIAISAVFVGGFIYVALLPHETKADDENRYLTEFPEFSAKSYASGEFTEGVADYFDDTVHDRAHIKEFISDYIIQLKGRKYGNDGEEAELFGSGFEKKATVTTAPVTTAASVSTTVTTAVQEETTAPAEEAPADGELTNNILIVNNRGVTLYGGAWGTEQEYASYVNLYKEKLPNVNVYSMVIPTACSYYLPDKYRDL
ncbi:MAG: hypothetical protein J6X85_01580, partial [Ruminococcus sp.]|nr:hypothetical protein [Ruminococcus sp.]